MTEPTSGRRRPWVISWVREETFWRDVVARALSGLIVVAVTFTIGRAVGYFQGPSGARVARGVGAYTVLALVAGGIWQVSDSMSWPRTRAGRVLVHTVAMLLILVLQGLMFKALGWFPRVLGPQPK